MLSRLAILIAAAGLIAGAGSPSEARAADAIVARDTKIVSILPLGNDLVYIRTGSPRPKRAFMAVFHGHLHRARGIPARASVGDIGLDSKGRKVLTFATTNRDFAATKWFVYDLAKNRTRPLRGLPSKCVPNWVALWRGRTAYTVSCNDKARDGLFVRQGRRRRHLPLEPGGGRFRLRGGTIAVNFDTGLDDYVVVQRMAGGKECTKQVDASYGDATSEYGWYPSGLWNSGDALIWTMGSWYFRPDDFVILTAKVRPGCQAPGPVGQLRWKPEVTPFDALSIDGRRLFYADDKALRRHILPAEPSFDPPPNDDFDHAQPLAGGPSFYAKGNVAYATVQSDEPLAEAKHTVWYSFRPDKSGTVYVNVPGACTQPAYCGGAPRYGVYTGNSPATLTPIPRVDDPYKTYTQVEAVAGETYWIAVGSPLPEPRHEPFVVTVTPNPPSF